MKFDVVVSDPPWIFSDRLQMSKTKRSAEDNYDVMNDQDIIDLDVKSIISDDAFLALWVPGSKLDIGIDCCKAWGFKPVQTWVWVKTKQEPLHNLASSIVNLCKSNIADFKLMKSLVKKEMDDFDLNECLNFFMGHSFRQTHEIAIIGGRGKYTKLLKDKSQRSVFIGPAIKNHSQKPESLQDKLDIMFPNVNKLEMFARRQRQGWICAGNENPLTVNEDICDSIKRLSKQ